MFKIIGTCVRRPRAQIPAPDDGVHRNGSDGFIKGAHAMYLNDEIPMYHGQVSLYWRLNEDRGLKVYYSVKHGWNANRKWVEAARRRMHTLSKKGICLDPGKIIEVYVDLRYKDKVHKKKTVYALEVPHIHYPDCWDAYTNGYPYDFSSYDHKDHTPEGYKRAKKFIDKTLRKAKMRDIKYVGDSFKLGDMLFCTKRNKWLLCDLG